MPQAISLQEQNGRDNIRQLCFDQLAERIENRRQRITFGDHLENAFLSGQQSFSPLSIFNVGQSSIPLQDIPLFISQRYGTSQQPRSEEHTSELQSLTNLVCRLLLEKKKP